MLLQRWEMCLLWFRWTETHLCKWGLKQQNKIDWEKFKFKFLFSVYKVYCKNCKNTSKLYYYFFFDLKNTLSIAFSLSYWINANIFLFRPLDEIYLYHFNAIFTIKVHLVNFSFQSHSSQTYIFSYWERAGVAQRHC